MRAVECGRLLARLEIAACLIHAGARGAASGGTLDGARWRARKLGALACVLWCAGGEGRCAPSSMATGGLVGWEWL